MNTQGVQSNEWPNTNDEITLKDVILKLRQWYLYLLSKWALILFLSVLGGLVGFIFSYYKSPLYHAETTFVLENGDGNGGGLGQYSGIASIVGIDIANSGDGGLFQGDNISELYRSRTMIKKTLLSSVRHNGRDQLFIDYYIQINQLRDKWKKNKYLMNLDFALSDVKFSRLRDSVLNEAVKDIRMNYLTIGKTDKKLNIISVNVSSKDEYFSKAFNDQIVKNVNDFYIQTKTRKSLHYINILQHKTDSVRNVMNGAIYRGAAAADATPNLNPTRQIQRVVPAQQSQFTVETNKAMLGELIKNLELSKLSLLKETPLIQVIDQPVFPLEKSKPSIAIMTALGFLTLAIISSIMILISSNAKN